MGSFTFSRAVCFIFVSKFSGFLLNVVGFSMHY